MFELVDDSGEVALYNKQYDFIYPLMLAGRTALVFHDWYTDTPIVISFKE